MKNSQQFPPAAAPVEPVAPMQAMPANDLIDPQALPPWMTGSPNRPSQPGQPAPYNAPPLNGQGGLAGSSLLDMNALPDWLREAEQTQNGPGGGAQGPAPYQNGPINPPPSPGQTPSGPGNLAAASLIDMNALPGWLRSTESQQGFPANSDPSVSRPSPFGPPPRPESVRVPNRPRGEIGPHEQSEVAANVFSSMLGVASSAPYYPSQSMNDAFGPSQNPSGANFQAGSQFVPPDSQRDGINSASTTMPPGYAPSAGSGSLQGYQGGYPTGYAPEGAYSAGNQPNNSSNIPPGTMNSAPAPGQNSSGSKSSNSKRRSFLDTIREWFSR